MTLTSPTVLIASVSARDSTSLSALLGRTGFATQTVREAREVADGLEANSVPHVLVIDSGMLDSPHDAQWRDLRARHPALGVVVRCLVPRAKRSLRHDGRTVRVHPDDEDGVKRAIRTLAKS
jgi:DNA-binding NtrC family response regulator